MRSLEIVSARLRLAGVLTSGLRLERVGISVFRGGSRAVLCGEKRVEDDHVLREDWKARRYLVERTSLGLQAMPRGLLSI